MGDPRPLHRLFGLSWIDFFRGTAVDVETEVDLSIKQQFLDLVIIRRGPEPIPRRLPDGFEDLAAHNLVTFKSHQEALDDWALLELIGHYVNYRKQSSPSMRDLLPETDYRLIAVAARFPQIVARLTELRPLSEGVYELLVLAQPIRVVVVGQLPAVEPNAILHLFSAREGLLRYGREHYRPHSPETSKLLYQLLTAYQEESDMTSEEKLKQFARESLAELLANWPAEERLKGLPAEERLKGLPAEERLKGLSADEVVRALPPETLQELAQKLKANGHPPKPE